MSTVHQTSNHLGEWGLLATADEAGVRLLRTPAAMVCFHLSQTYHNLNHWHHTLVGGVLAD